MCNYDEIVNNLDKFNNTTTLLVKDLQCIKILNLSQNQFLHKLQWLCNNTSSSFHYNLLLNQITHLQKKKLSNRKITKYIDKLCKKIIDQTNNELLSLKEDIEQWKTN